MAEKLPDHRQALSERERPAGKGVPEVVQSNVLQSCPGPEGRQQDLNVPGKDGRPGFHGVAGLPAAADGTLGQAEGR